MNVYPFVPFHDITFSGYIYCQLHARISSKEKVSLIPGLSYADLSQTTRSCSGFTSPLLQGIG